MFGLKRCCDCNKIVWWGQQSKIHFGPIHKKCHREGLKEFYDGGEMQKKLMKEINEFETKTGLDSGLPKTTIR